MILPSHVSSCKIILVCISQTLDLLLKTYKNIPHESETLIKHVETLPPGFHDSLFTFTTTTRLYAQGNIADCFAQLGPSKLRICFSDQERPSETLG